MHLLADPLTLAFQYLLLTFTGTPLKNLIHEFDHGDRIGKYYSYYPNPDGQTIPGQNEEFDFIIVGSGSSGAVVANRLSARRNFRVLLIEAGGNPFPLTNIPSMAMQMQGQPNFDWNYRTTPQENSLKALVNNSALFNRGKGLGGSSLLNYMMYMRGNPLNYDEWAELTGDKNWAYENVRHYFKKMENYNGYFPNNELHGRSGPLSVEAPSFVPFLHEWIEAGKEMGLKVNDPNGYQNESVFPIDTTTKGGTRYSTHRAYIYPALHRPNLKIYTYSLVEKIHLDAENKKAVGVSFIRNGQTHYVSARREIILSAGAINSPQLLMLSGIGDQSHLESIGIPVKKHLPGVGKNFMDHFVANLGPFLVQPGKSIIPKRDLNKQNLAEYLTCGKGPFSTVGAGAGMLFSSSLADTNPSRGPDLYSTYIGVGLGDSAASDFSGAWNVQPGILEKYFAQDIGNDGLIVIIVLGRPKSRGEIKLQSKNIMDHPIINPNYLSHPDDLKKMVEGAKFVVKMINGTAAFKKIGGRITSSLFPGCEQFSDNTSDDYWSCLVQHFSGTMFHYSGTVKMGQESDSDACVDSNLRIFGIPNLRVVDSSIMPTIVNTPTNGPCIMIGEMASDMILKAHS